jgi:hypothetical protein
VGELQRHPKVRHLSVQAVQLAFQAQRALVAAVDPWRDLFHQAGKALQVSTARSLYLGGLGQALQRVLADRAEQVVPRAAIHVVYAQERLVGQPCQQLEHALCTDAGPGGHLLGRGQREAAREHCKSAENHALVLAQQVVAPVKGRPQGLVAVRGRARATDQYRENVVQTLSQLADGQHPHLGPGQLDRQRQAVEPPAYLHDGLGIVVADPERRKHQLCAVLEEPDRVGLREGGRRRRRATRWQRQRRHRPAALPVHPEHLAAGRKDRQGGTSAEQPPGKNRHRGSQVLAIVQDDQHRAVAHVLCDCLCGVLARAVRHAKPARDHPGHDAGIIQWRELHPGHALGVGHAHSARSGKRQPGLPDSSRSGQGQQPAARQAVHHILQFPLPAHQRSQPDRKPAGNQRGHGPALALPRPAPARAGTGMRAAGTDGSNASPGAVGMPGLLPWPQGRIW